MSNGPATGKPHAPIEVEWITDARFEAGRGAGPRARIDGDGNTAPSPFDMLLAALGTCAATDVVAILKKQRTPARALQVRVVTQRVAETPRRLSAAVLQFTIDAPGATEAKVARAVELAVTKYCSVRSSLRGDVPVTWTIHLKS